MDDAFAKRFDTPDDQKRDDDNIVNNPDDDGKCGVAPLMFCGSMERPATKKQNAQRKEPWSTWILNKLGIELSVESISHNADGTVSASHYTSKPTGTYTNKKSRTFVENGKKVSVMSMEKDGNMIEDKFIGGELVERKVNGIVEEMPKQVTN